MTDKPQDTKEAITDGIGDLEAVDVYHNQILIGVWKRPDKTAGGIILTDKTRDEDRYQGKVGLVLKKGPLAFLPDGSVEFGGLDVAVGDWVAYRVSDGWSLKVNGMDCRMLEDIHIKMRVSEPGIIY